MNNKKVPVPFIFKMNEPHSIVSVRIAKKLSAFEDSLWGKFLGMSKEVDASNSGHELHQSIVLNNSALY